MTFSKKLKALRAQNHLTQSDVAKYLNVARSTIAGYETKNRQPSHEKLTALANLFHTSIDYLLDDETITLECARYVIQDDSEKNLVSRYRRLSSESRKHLEEYIRLLELSDSSKN